MVCRWYQNTLRPLSSGERQSGWAVLPESFSDVAGFWYGACTLAYFNVGCIYVSFVYLSICFPLISKDFLFSVMEECRAYSTIRRLRSLPRCRGQVLTVVLPYIGGEVASIPPTTTPGWKTCAVSLIPFFWNLRIFFWSCWGAAQFNCIVLFSKLTQKCVAAKWCCLSCTLFYTWHKYRKTCMHSNQRDLWWGSSHCQLQGIVRGLLCCIRGDQY